MYVYRFKKQMAFSGGLVARAMMLADSSKDASNRKNSSLP